MDHKGLGSACALAVATMGLPGGGRARAAPTSVLVSTRPMAPAAVHPSPEDMGRLVPLVNQVTPSVLPEGYYTALSLASPLTGKIYMLAVVCHTMTFQPEPDCT